MQKIILTSPTVKELIGYLSKMPQDMPVRIKDPDTGWEIDKVHANISFGILWLTGEYDEMKTASTWYPPPETSARMARIAAEVLEETLKSSGPVGIK